MLLKIVLNTVLHPQNPMEIGQNTGTAQYNYELGGLEFPLN